MTTSRSEGPKCEACDDAGSWLVGVRLPNDEQVKLCPPCARRVEQLDARSHDWSDPGHPDNTVREMPKEDNRCFAFYSPAARPPLTEKLLLEDQTFGSLGTFGSYYRDPAANSARPLPKNHSTFRKLHQDRKDRDGH